MVKLDTEIVRTSRNFIVCVRLAREVLTIFVLACYQLLHWTNSHASRFANPLSLRGYSLKFQLCSGLKLELSLKCISQVNHNKYSARFRLKLNIYNMVIIPGRRIGENCLNYVLVRTLGAL